MQEGPDDLKAGHHPCCVAARLPTQKLITNAQAMTGRTVSWLESDSVEASDSD